MICSRSHSHGQLRFALSVRPRRFGTKPTQRREGAGVQPGPSRAAARRARTAQDSKGEQEFGFQEQGNNTARTGTGSPVCRRGGESLPPKPPTGEAPPQRDLGPAEAKTANVYKSPPDDNIGVGREGQRDMAAASEGERIARERIAREAVERTGVLDLGRLNLTELPAELFGLKHLRSLNLGSGGRDSSSMWARSRGEYRR